MQLDLVTTVRAILFQFVPSPLGVLYLYNIWSYWARVVANLRSGGNTLGFSYDIVSLGRSETVKNRQWALN